jgi:pyridoxal phosphate enzyme (YggS family)
MSASPSDKAPPLEPGFGPDQSQTSAGEGGTVSLERNLAELRRQLPPLCRLLAVSKGQPADVIRRAVAAGQRSFGESRLQEAITKQEQLADLAPLDWHFIGRLQANKARAVLRRFGTIHSLDSLALAERLARIAAEEGLAPQVFLQVKLRPDPAKTGFEPADLLDAWPRLSALTPLRPVGLMLIQPLGLGPQERSALFAECATLGQRLALAELSMGMSGDWREAAAAGSTWVRIGTALFGDRPGPAAPSGTDFATTTP